MTKKGSESIFYSMAELPYVLLIVAIFFTLVLFGALKNNKNELGKTKDLLNGKLDSLVLVKYENEIFKKERLILKPCYKLKNDSIPFSLARITVLDSNLFIINKDTLTYFDILSKYCEQIEFAKSNGCYLRFEIECGTDKIENFINGCKNLNRDKEIAIKPPW